MKTLITLFIVIGTFGVSGAQIGKKITTAPVSTTTYKVAATNFSAAEMALISNTNGANLGIFVADKTPKETQTLDVNAMIVMNISKNIFGDNSPKNYGITYWSDPVLKLYNKYIEPNLAKLIESNDNTWNSNNQSVTDYITNQVADQLTEAATNAGAYVNTADEKQNGGNLGPETLKLFKTYTKEQFKSETWTADYQQPYYFEYPLVSIHDRMPIDNVHTQGAWGSSTSWPANTRGWFFMSGPGARATCAVAVIIAKIKIDGWKQDSKLTQLLQSANWGTLYRPLLEYKNQSAFFDVHQISMNWLQLLTGSGQANELFDIGNNCPSESAYVIAQKIRSASVFNSAK